MSTLAQRRDAPVRVRARRSLLFIIGAVVLALAVAEFINLAGRHLVGAEAYGVAVAGVAVAAGILSLGVLLSPRRRAIATGLVLGMWGLVAVGGIAGSYYHIVGVAAEYSPVDPRPRPMLAPMVFTLLAVIDVVAVVLAYRAATRPGQNGRPDSSS